MRVTCSYKCFSEERYGSVKRINKRIGTRNASDVNVGNNYLIVLTKILNGKRNVEALWLRIGIIPGGLRICGLNVCVDLGSFAVNFLYIVHIRP